MQVAKLFLMHTGFNVLLLAYHGLAFLVIVMAVGGDTFNHEEAVRFYFASCFFGILPNLIIIITSYFFKMESKKNIIIGIFFLLITLMAYLYGYRAILAIR